MKYLINFFVLIFFSILLIGCVKKDEKISSVNETEILNEKNKKYIDSLGKLPEYDTIIPKENEWKVGKFSHYYVVEIDGCEYLYDANYDLSVPGNLIHKGNCKNKIHEYRQN